jgi:hypothetical protein
VSPPPGAQQLVETRQLGEAEQLVEAVAAYALPADGAVRPAPMPARPLRDGVWADVLARCRSQRLMGFLQAAVGAGALPTDPKQAAAAAGAHRDAMGSVLLLERLLLDTVAALGRARLDVRVLKGSSAAHLDYPAPELRAFGDVDLLVRAEQFDDAVAVLSAAGHHRRYPQPRPGFDRRFSKGASFVTGAGSEIDVHRSFAMGPFGLTMKLGDLWARQATFRLGGVDLVALAREERFLHACFHAALGDDPPRLLALRDVAQALLGGELDVHLVRALTASWQADAVVARAVRLTCAAFGIDAGLGALTRWAGAYEPDRRARRALASYTHSEGGYPVRSLAALREVAGVRGKTAYLRALAFPARDYVGPRHHGYVDRWRHGARAILQRSGRR